MIVLSLKVCREFEARLRQHFGRTDTDDNAITIADALQILSRIIFLNYRTGDHLSCRLTALDDKQTALFHALHITLPKKPPQVV